ncbi:MAG: hypothetical protein K9H64_12455 [Bacteroidales bacterium]|nr:hypothetical protein [Bacteroidales bacterium]MCF8456856.1 hypothetical protein [Bacteroidales bacterium]
MNTYSLVGAIVVTFALISYTIGIISEQRSKRVNRMVLIFLSIGIVLDIFATACMILGSPNSPFTFHGFVGYSGLAAMLTDTILIWRLYAKNELNVTVPRNLHLYSRYAYLWWVGAFITGALLVALK